MLMACVSLCLGDTWIYTTPGADPGFEVRGGAKGLENLESGEEGGDL